MDTKKIIVALDGMDRDQALMLAWTLSGRVWGFKVNDLLLEYGTEIVRAIRCLGKVFADPKLYDIENTVVNSVLRLSQAGADMITVHASGGEKVIRAAANAAGNSKILAVTALTSFTNQDCQRVYGKPVNEVVWDLAHLACESGAHGIVCSPKEVDMFKHLNLIKVTPGIRSAPEGDQCRVQATSNADYWVIGRPITAANDPMAALDELEAL